MPRKRVPVRMFGPPRQRPTPSPIQDPMGLIPLLEEMRMMFNFVKKHAPMIGEVREKLENFKEGKPGMSGRNVTQAEVDAAVRRALKQPADGKDGKDADPEQVAALLEPKLAKLVKKHTKPGLAGKNADPIDMDTAIKALLAHIEKNGGLTIDHMPGVKKLLETRVAELRNQFALSGKQYGKDTLIRGGGMTMSAGANITLVPKSDGTVEINASGGGSGTNVITQYVLTAEQLGADVTIDLSQLAHFATMTDLIALYRNNVPQTEGASFNFTVTGSVVTIFNADAGEIFNITYAYA